MNLSIEILSDAKYRSPSSPKSISICEHNRVLRQDLNSPLMSEEIHIPKTAVREDIYRSLLPQLKGLTEGEPDFIANTANIMAALKDAFGFLWIGCYFVRGEELVLGPFQGPVACTRIRRGKGVCGTAWDKNETIIVPDVEKFPGHIACSTLSVSEIVVPLRAKDGSAFGVLDIDSVKPDDFSAMDQKYLEQVAVLLGDCFGE